MPLNNRLRQSLFALFTLTACWLGMPDQPASSVPASSSSKPTLLPTVRFVSFGDMGTGGQLQYQVAKAIQAKCKASGCDFAVTVGDNIYNNGVTSVTDPQFQTKFEKPYEPLDFRFYMTLGNHDYRGNVQAQLDYTQRSHKWYMPKRYYQFEAGPVTFFALDTNQIDTAQQQFLTDGLKQAKTPWKIAFGHHPRYTNSFYKNTQSPALKELVDSLCGQGQLYLSGHEHDKQRLKPVCGVEHLVIGTGGGLRQVGRGPNTLFAASTGGFAWVEINPYRMYVEVLDVKGKVEHKFSVMK